MEFEGGSPYHVETSLELDTMGGFEEASKDTLVFDDVPRFSSKGPVIMVGRVVGGMRGQGGWEGV